MAYDDGLAGGIELRHARRDVAHRDVSRAGEGRDCDFGGLANVEDEDAIASIEAGLECRGFDCAEIRHQASGESGTLLFTVYRLMSSENISTLENIGSSLHGIENRNVSL